MKRRSFNRFAASLLLTPFIGFQATQRKMAPIFCMVAKSFIPDCDGHIGVMEEGVEGERRKHVSEKGSTTYFMFTSGKWDVVGSSGPSFIFGVHDKKNLETGETESKMFTRGLTPEELESERAKSNCNPIYVD